MKPIHTKNRAIGLLGGSFNPAHEGHLQLTQSALKVLKLDAVWWLVAPHNPLKSAASLAPYAKRLRSALTLASGHPRVHVSDIETRLGTKYSVDTVTALQRRFPGARFIWLMGADNLAQLHRWKRWPTLIKRLPVAVFDRAPFSHTAMRSKAYRRSQKFLIKNNQINRKYPVPGLFVVRMRRNPISSTLLRKRLEKWVL